MKRIETLEQKQKALAWMVKMAKNPFDVVNTDPKIKQIYEATEKAVWDYNQRAIPTLHDDLEPEPVQEPEPIKEPTAAKASWLDD